MIFLICYDRGAGKIRQFNTYADNQRAEAEATRLKLELVTRNELAENEVVLLEARSEDDLRRTHRRYFSSTADLLKAAAESTTASAK